MHAYSQVDLNVRRKFEEMLKTWREPVPGSLSPTPVFPISSTQSIVDSLSKFRAATAGGNRYQGTPVQGVPARVATSQPYRQTPTPPQSQAQYPPSIPTHIRSPVPPQANPYTQPPTTSYPPAHSTPIPPYYQQAVPPQTTSIQQYPLPAQPVRPSSASQVDIQRLHAEIDDLTTDAKIECATHPMNHGAQRQLASLQTLKEILDSGSASEADLQDIRSTITQKMAERRVSARPQVVQPVPPQPAYGAIPPQIQQTPAQGLTGQPSLGSLFNSTNLAELLRATAQQSQQQAAAQPNLFPQAQAAVNNPGANGYPPPPPAPTENPLIAQLRASGLLSAMTTPLQGVTPPNFQTPYTPDPAIEVPLTSASIRIPRPHLIQSFLGARSNQCSTCGRRFSSDDIGREKKAAHLDWHFKTKERMLEAEKRGQNRSWYVDERDWISSKEYEDDAGENNGLPTNGAPAKKKVDFVRAPTDPVLRSLPCPIDQEPFKSEWSEEVQDFIWKDAIQVGGRYYHASCYAEVSKGREKDGVSTPVPAGTGRTATPDSVLGKRKAEVC